jgi:hypothetical protein
MIKIARKGFDLKVTVLANSSLLLNSAIAKSQQFISNFAISKFDCVNDLSSVLGY